MKKLLIVFLLLSSGLCINSAYSQKTRIYNEPDAEYRLALELFNKEKYVAAQKAFLNVKEQLGDGYSEMKINCEFYAALCALELFNKDAEYLLMKFLQDYPENPKVRLVYFHLGKHYFRKKNYKNAIDWFAKVDVYDLTNAELSEYYFKSGYSYFMEQDYEKAKKNLFEVKDLDNKYGPPANYYYSHIAYIQKNYETALQGFLKLRKNELFGSMIPYYVTQIYYLQGNYEKVISYAPGLLDSANVQRVPEIARIIGESYFKLQKYKECIPYLEKYKAKSAYPMTREENYELAYAYYRSQDYKKAIENFANVATENDYITQCTHYHAAGAYLKLNQKEFARNSFLAASKMDIDKKIQEDALFNYAKLAYELSYNPYNEAINAFHKYIKDYPNSPNLNEVYEYLSNIYLTTKNYKDALASIEKLELKDERLKAAYQKIAFFRGTELFNDKAYFLALKHFNKSLKYPMDKYLTANSHYWKGEAFYRLEKYDSSAASFQQFIQSPGAISLPYYNTANYNTGYCFFKTKKYSEASKWFRKYLAAADSENPTLVNDAYLRLADCFYMMKDYEQSVEYYSRAAEKGKMDGDYALYQKGMALGLMGKNQEKISTLEQMQRLYQGSSYLPEARFELGKTYQIVGRDSAAIAILTKVVNEHPTSSFAKKAMLRKGLILRNIDRDDEALAIFKQVVASYPGTDESKEALMSIRNIYVDKNEADEFFVYVKSLNYTEVSEASQDTTFYQAAENRYMDGDCEGASKGFRTYIERFPNGVFILPANYYKGECDYKAGKFDEALTCFNFVISKPQNKFSENALLRASAINMKKKNYADARNNFAKLEENAEYKKHVLEARVGLMRTNFYLNDYAGAIEASRKLLETEKAGKELQDEARLIIAKSLYAQNKLTEASGEFQVVAKSSKNEMGAEAKYNVAEIYYKQQLYDQAEKDVFELINQVPSYDYWVAKGFILLADIYVAKGNVFQAKHTLQSIIDNYEGADLVKIAQEKLNKILLKEQESEKRKAQEEIMLKFNQDSKIEQLFENPSVKDTVITNPKDSSQGYVPENIGEPQPVKDNAVIKAAAVPPTKSGIITPLGEIKNEEPILNDTEKPAIITPVSDDDAIINLLDELPDKPDKSKEVENPDKELVAPENKGSDIGLPNDNPVIEETKIPSEVNPSNETEQQDNNNNQSEGGQNNE